MGLLDFLNTDEGRLGLGLLAAAGPRSDGMGAGGRIQEAFAGADARKRAQAEDEWKKLQMEEARQQMAQRQQAAQRKQQIQGLAQRFQTPAQPGFAALSGDPSSGILPSQGRAAVPAGFDYQGYAGALAGVDPIKALALQQSLQKENTINKLDVKDFTPQSVAKYSQSRNYGDLVRMDKLHFGDTGGAIKGFDPFSGSEVSSNDKTQSPDNFATVTEQMRSRNQTNALGWANNGIARERLNFDKAGGAEGGKPQLVDGQWVYKPSAQFPQGRVMAVPGISDKPLNESQGAATNFGNRALQAHEILTQLERTGGGQPGAIKRTLTAATPGLGMSLDDSMGTLTNWTQSKGQQAAEQAQRNFITAVLRKESGASISPGEFSTASQIYFPQPNDDEATRAQKAKTRNAAIEGLKIQAGPGAKHIKPSFSGGASGSFADDGKEARYQQWKKENGQ